MRACLELKIPPLLLTIITSVMMVWLADFLPSITVPSTVLYSISGLLFVLAFGLCLLGVMACRRQATTVDPRYPDTVNSLVESGVFKYSRNPMYLGFVIWLCALVVVLASPWLLCVVLAFVVYLTEFQIKPEERALMTLFGESYGQYKQRVRRWV
jgi:protein-S-isoprenylcysteine O-methyltransferase Ste14